MTAFACHNSCQSGKWQGFVSRGDKVALSFGDGIMCHLAVAPCAFHHLAVAGAEPFEMAVLPYRWQGGQQLNVSVMALQQHLGYAGRAAEVAVDLERRMGTEEVGIGAS